MKPPGPSRSHSWRANTVAYIDTLGCELPLPPIVAALEQSARGKVFARKLALRIQQPAQSTLRSLRLHDAKICRVDIGFDVLRSNAAAAEETGNWFRLHMLQKWRGKKSTHQHKNSHYYSRDARVERNINLYWDKESKTGLGPCAHIDLRFFKARACRRAGIDDAATLIAGIDVMSLLKRQTRLCRIDSDRFERKLEKLARAHLRTNRANVRSNATHPVIDAQFNTVAGVKERIRQVCLRRFARKDTPVALGFISVQEFYDRTPVMRSCLTPIPWEQVVSAPPQWLHWQHHGGRTGK